MTEGTKVTLDGGKSSDSDGKIAEYEWKIGKEVLSKEVSFSKDDFRVGTHTITLTVTDDDGATASDDVVITINEKGNNAPIARAGKDQSVIEGDKVTLDGRDSSDSDGDITEYEWRIGKELINRESIFTKSDFQVGTHTITLTVTDDDGATGSDDVVITVNKEGNKLPIARAGKDQTVAEGDKVSFDGSDSSDEDGDIVKYEWTIGQEVIGREARFTIDNFKEGTHTVTLTVTDDADATASDDVVITVKK